MALKIVYQICCGIDVHKTFVVACIASTNKQGVTTYKRHRFSTFTQGLKELLQWLLDNQCKDVCMESTGKYWIPIYNVLEKDCNIVLAHPKYVKAIRGKKTDKFHAIIHLLSYQLYFLCIYLAEIFLQTQCNFLSLSRQFLHYSSRIVLLLLKSLFPHSDTKFH